MHKLITTVTYIYELLLRKGFKINFTLLFIKEILWQGEAGV